MKFDKAYVIGSEKVSKTRLNNFFKKNTLKNKEIKIWPAINGLDVNIKKYQDLKYLTENFREKLQNIIPTHENHMKISLSNK